MQFNGMAAVGIAAAAIVPFFASPQSAFAQTSSPENLAKGKKLYDQAIILMEATRYREACPKLEEVVDLVPEGIGGKITLAECYEADGRLVRAYEAFKAAEQAAAKAGQAEREKKAQDRAAAILPRVSKLIIVVPDAVRALPGLEVRRDGLVVDSSGWGAPIVVEGGEHRVMATATGKEPWEKGIEITGGGSQGSITIPATWAGASDSGGGGGVPASSGGFFSGSTQRKVGILVGAAGAAGLLGGGVAGIISIVQKGKSNSDGHCNETTNVCDQTGVDLRASATAAGNAATGLFISGGVLGAAAAVLYLTAPSSEEPAPKAALIVGPQGIYLRGTW